MVIRVASRRLFALRDGDPVPASLVGVRRKGGSRYGLLHIRNGQLGQRNAMHLATSCAAFSKTAR